MESIVNVDGKDYKCVIGLLLKKYNTVLKDTKLCKQCVKNCVWQLSWASSNCERET